MIAYHFPYENKTSNNRMMSPVVKCDCQLVVKTGKEQAELTWYRKWTFWLTSVQFLLLRFALKS